MIGIFFSMKAVYLDAFGLQDCGCLYFSNNSAVDKAMENTCTWYFTFVQSENCSQSEGSLKLLGVEA